MGCSPNNIWFLAAVEMLKKRYLWRRAEQLSIKESDCAGVAET
jgi:hypothetical protein